VGKWEGRCFCGLSTFPPYDTTDRSHLKQLLVVSFGKDTGPHNLVLSNNDDRLTVSDYFLNEDDSARSTSRATTRFA
jgi:hypothetical protein